VPFRFSLLPIVRRQAGSRSGATQFLLDTVIGGSGQAFSLFQGCPPKMNETFPARLKLKAAERSVTRALAPSSASGRRQART
jgi:hypothetical protein